MPAPRKASQDFTGRQREALAAEHAEELKAREEELGLVHKAEAEAAANEILDVSKQPEIPVVLDQVEVVASADDGTEVIRVAEDMQQVTIGDKTYDFVAGRKYRVPTNVAFHLRGLGFLYERA